MPSRKGVTSSGDAVFIEGLADFTRGLKYAADAAPDAMKKANYDVANFLVRSAKTRAGGWGGVQVKAAKSLRATRTASYASIRGGGPRAPWFWGAEFGAYAYKQFKSWRGNQWGGWAGGPGYFLAPSIRAQGPAAVSKYMDEIDRITQQAFPGF